MTKNSGTKNNFKPTGIDTSNPSLGLQISSDCCPYDLNSNGGMIGVREKYKQSQSQEYRNNHQEKHPYDLSRRR